MAREVHRFAVTVPANTPQATPQLTNLTMPPREVVEVTIVIPPGPRGELGFALALAGRAIIPYEPAAFFVADNEVIHWPLEKQPSSGAWQCLAFNTGQFPHTLEFRFLTDLPGEAPPPPLSLFSADQLSQPAVLP